MLDGFKKFILRGNVVDMAVGVVIWRRCYRANQGISHSAHRVNSGQAGLFQSEIRDP